MFTLKRFILFDGITFYRVISIHRHEFIFTIDFDNQYDLIQNNKNIYILQK